MSRRLYNGVRLLGNGPSLVNIEKIDMGARPMLIEMLKTGLQVDLDHFAKLEKQLVEDMDKVTEDVRRTTGYYVNIDSPQQVSDLLFKKLGLHQARPKFTKGSDGEQESVEYEVLVAIQHDHECVPLILEYKELSKLKGTYVHPMPFLARRVRLNEWRIFPNLGDTRVPSGRLNCKEPNLLAMPSRTERGKDIRRGFITKPGWKYLSVDESQIEVRLAAHCSRDPRLMGIYTGDIEDDIYSDFAVSAFHLDPKRHIKEGANKWAYDFVHPTDHRYPSKTCVLASIYDVSPGGLLEQMPIVCDNCGWISYSLSNSKYSRHTCPKFVARWTEQKCADLIAAFYRTYKGVMDDRLRNHRIAMKNGFVWDMWGRVLHVAAVRSVLPWVVSAALREVGNFPYQSGAQGTIKLTMAEMFDVMRDANLLEVCHPLLQIHDELLYEVRDDVAEEIGELNRYIFEHCADLAVPIKANATTADNWGDLEK